MIARRTFQHPDNKPIPAREPIRQDRAKLDAKKSRRELHWHIMEARKLGRPPVYEEHAEEIDKLVYDYRMLGITVMQIADLFGISSATLYIWQEQHPTFLDAWNRGGDLADAEISRAVFHRARGYSHVAEKIQLDKEGEWQRTEFVEHYPPDTAAATFWLTNRQRATWKSRQSTELGGPDGAPLTPPTINIMGVEAAKKD